MLDQPVDGTTSPGFTSRSCPGSTDTSGGEVSWPSSWRWTTRGARAMSAWSSLSARALARASRARPPVSITAITAPAKYSPTAKVPASASTATRSTPGRRRRTLATTHPTAGMSAATVVAAHKVWPTPLAPAATATPPRRRPPAAVASSPTSPLRRLGRGVGASTAAGAWPGGSASRRMRAPPPCTHESCRSIGPPPSNARPGAKVTKPPAGDLGRHARRRSPRGR